MKTSAGAKFLTISTAALVACLCGCEKQDQSPTEPSGSNVTVDSSPSPTPANVVTGAVQATSDQAATVHSSATQASNQAAAQVKTAGETTSTQAQTLLDQARSLVAEKKYEEALSTLKQVSNLKLTPEQQKLLENLQRQIQNGLVAIGATNATSKLNSLLGGKK